MTACSYKVGPPSYKMVYKPHEYYSYRYHKPYSYWSYLHQLSYRTGAPLCNTLGEAHLCFVHIPMVAIIHIHKGSSQWDDPRDPARTQLALWSRYRLVCLASFCWARTLLGHCLVFLIFIYFYEDFEVVLTQRYFAAKTHFFCQVFFSGSLEDNHGPFSTVSSLRHLLWWTKSSGAMLDASRGPRRRDPRSQFHCSWPLDPCWFWRTVPGRRNVGVGRATGQRLNGLMFPVLGWWLKRKNMIQGHSCLYFFSSGGWKPSRYI